MASPLIDDEEDEIFFGHVTLRESKRIAKYAHRKTEVFFDGYRQNMSILDDNEDEKSEVLDKMNASNSDDEADVGSINQSLCDTFSHMRMTASSLLAKQNEEELVADGHTDNQIQSLVDLVVAGHADNKIQSLDDSLEVHRRRSSHTVDLQSSCYVPETSVEEENSSADNSIDVVEDTSLTASDEYVTVQPQASVEIQITAPEGCVPPFKTEIDLEIEDVAHSSQSSDSEKEEMSMSYESHFVTAFSTLESDDTSKIETVETSVSVVVPSLLSEDLSIIVDGGNEPCNISGIQSLSTTSTFEDSLEKRQSIGDQEIGIEEIQNKSCQTSFAINVEVPKRSDVCKNIPKMSSKNNVRHVPIKSSRIPTPLKQTNKDVGPRNKLPVTHQSTLKLPFPVPHVKPPTGSFKQASKLKFQHVRSPIAAYIHDDPAQPLIQNVKPRMSPAWKLSNQGLKTKPHVERNILKENHNGNVVVTTTEPIASNNYNDNGNKDDENVDPFQPPLPYVIYKSSKVMIEKKCDRIAKQPAIISCCKIPSPRFPVVLKHTGQHKKIHWADHLIRGGGRSFSPSRPTGVAPPILIKGIDFNNSSVVDGPDTIDASIVEVMSAKRTLYKK